MRKITAFQARFIFNILVEHAGAHEDDKKQFLVAQANRKYPCREFRFCGSLGFGGKFWNNNGKLYINCYQEDETPKRNRIIKLVNRILKDYSDVM